MKRIILCFALLSFLCVCPGFSQNNDQKIQTLEKQVKDLQQLTQDLKTELTDLKSQKSVPTPTAARQAPTAPVATLSEEAEAQSNVVIAGYAASTFTAKSNEDSTFSARFNPIFLYRYGDRLLAEGGFEISLEREAGKEGEAAVEMEFGSIDYVVCDYLTLVAGKFLLPVGKFGEKLEPLWINKLPTKPLPYADGLIPEGDVGVQGRGAFNAGDAVLSYAVFGSNGPTTTNEDVLDATGAVIGTKENLELNGNFADNNDNKAFGGRGAIFYPFETFSAELGISGLVGNYDNAGDLSFSAIVIDGEIHALENLLQIRGEGLFTTQETLAGDVDRNGGYIQASYKLAAIDAPVICNTELVFRYGLIRSDEEGQDQDQYTIGGNYYFTNTFLLKLAYDFNSGDTEETDADTFSLQFAYGF